MSSSSSSNTTQSQQSTSQSTVNTVDNRQVSGTGATVGGNVTVTAGDASKVSITNTDLGAVKAGLDLATESIAGIQAASQNAQDATKSIASDSISQAYGLANAARQSETSGAINSLTKYLFWIGLAGIGAFVVIRARKS